MIESWSGISWTPKNILKMLVLVLIIRPGIWFFLGLNRYSRFKIDATGPLIIAANHNSHLDTFLLFALLPLPIALRTSCIAAGDYFYDIPFVGWFLFDLFEMIPVWRNSKRGHGTDPQSDPVSSMAAALDNNRVVMLFPEGTRGLPEQRQILKKGIARLAVARPQARIVPIFLRGLGKALPRGEMVFVPLIPQVGMDQPIEAAGKTEDQIMEELAASFAKLEATLPNRWVIP